MSYPASGTARASRPRRAPTNRIVDRVVTMRDQCVGDRQRRGHVTAGSATGDHCMDRAAGHARPWRATFTRTPAPTIVQTSAVPPNDTNGKGTPVTGSTPTTPPRLSTAWPTIQAVAPAASSVPNRSGARAAVRIPIDRDEHEDGDDQQRAEQTQLLADHREDEVGVRGGQEAPLGAARAEADTGPAAAYAGR